MFKFVLVINPLSVLLQVFYQMCKSLNPIQLAQLKLPEEYRTRPIQWPDVTRTPLPPGAGAVVEEGKCAGSCDEGR